MPAVTSATHPFGSLLSAMVTPMTADGAVDLEATVRLAKHLVDSGHDGLVLNGTTGEAPTTHAPEKAEIVAAVVEAVGDRAYVVAGAGSNDTAHAVRMGEQAAEAGAHGLLVVTPYYSRPSQDGIVAHVAAVADATGLPVMLYDVPGRAGVRLTPATIDRLAAHERVVAMKDATGDVVAAAQSVTRTGLAWYSGDDGLALAFLAHGAVGLVGVTTQAAPRAFAQLFAAWRDGDAATALDVYRGLLPAITALNGAGFQAVAAKAALVELGVLDSRATRLPLVPFTDDEAAAVRAGLAASGLLDVVAGADRA
ncbi:4-hydroxy-tetrahydrodipicolinate synthase [Cellulomonas wangsupingiae]|uniref:4-hydroxy-tetrahydrodipicolinate synthase n=1 Tax=Cellulomonas wangsupingiae TaxID=2968085 RepID=A0ABY5K813_9CELL|nr:4-hydroxy-tetrahydrodipicolinate synthase [Cellulomonas wangsupingiae]MCC2335259.1 4-hydroxy-tetrahydrodipicolinate synthase [Cellulomonas wangsupingiae]MCM0639121.1 4-hydroxy-tetrahydrodipicolinate synthase [Cellulomonas wangsupingiae]UUI66602.1 4-hydroxy-tetrahydrodipicolinate synthase [Cellulomonas wangsupingiae]